jgi:dipeptidyl aminopeptidase/acylaminoacyl peptidase
MPLFRAIRIFFIALCISSPIGSQEPQTVAEASGFSRTSRHDEVLDFCAQLAQKAPQRLRLMHLGVSEEGRTIPLLVIADPPVSSPREVLASKKLVVLIQANIHAGEVDGKEAALMLARDLVSAMEAPWLKDLVILIVPNLNPDGNERFSETNRRQQNGPSLVGTRGNARGLDLNRDFVKLESAEIRALVRAFHEWNPGIVIDMHTTNGSHHRHLITHDGPRNPAISQPLVDYTHKTLLPDLNRRLEKRSGIVAAPYGFMNQERTRWESYPAQPRYSIQYVGLRGRIGLLCESFAYAPYKDRVLASRDFLMTCLDFAAANRGAIEKVLAEAARDFPARLAIAHRLKARSTPGLIRGFVEHDGKPDWTQPKDYTVELVDVAEPTLFVDRPFAYLLPETLKDIVPVLQYHGIVVHELREDVTLPISVHHVRAVRQSERAFQGHRTTQLEVEEAVTKTRVVPAGTFVIRTDQGLGRLVSLLLEPNSEDGLVTWNYFDRHLQVGSEYPIGRLTQSTPLLTSPAASMAEERRKPRRIRPEDLTNAERLPDLNGSPIRGLTWLRDGEHLLHFREGGWYRIHATTGTANPFADLGKVAETLVRDLKLPDARARQIAQVSRPTHGRMGGFAVGFRMNPQQTGFLFEEDKDLYFARFDGSQAVRLTKTPGREELATFSPDGRFVAFVRDNDLYTVEIDTQREFRLTHDGNSKIFNGKADWVYYEEIFNRDYKAFWWSPDSRSLAFIRYDDTPVSPFPVVDHTLLQPKTEWTPYPKVGAPNPLVQLGIVRATGGPVQFATTPDYPADDTLLLRAGWQRDSHEVLFYLTNRIQTWLDVMSVRVGSDGTIEGPARQLFRETTPAWVDDPGDPIFLNDGRFLLTSERDGWKHLYLYSRDGKLIRRVTQGPWEVRRVHHVDEKSGVIYFTGTVESAIGENLYRASIHEPGPVVALTRGGTHRIMISPTGSYFVDTVSNHRTPSRTFLRKLDGQTVRTLDSNPLHALHDFALGRFELVKVPARDGFVMEGSLLYPVDFDPTQKYPVWFMTYGGPHAPTINDAWQFRWMDHVLSALGIFVFRCDPRSASGKGAVSTWTAYKKLGIQEHRDVEDAIDWLIARHPYIDASRIGMSGASYGGFLTAFCMTHGTKFAAGIAAFPVTDWTLYDSIYTERYMDLPSNNPEGYKVTSVVRAAKNLHGRLLLIHGLMDDNVHIQNTIQFIEELQKAGKQFEIMVYPKARHGIEPPYGNHYQKLQLEFIRRTLGR